MVVPAFLAMCVWQVSRALGGNELSWAYVFEWPLFAAYAVYMWWRLAPRGPPEDAPGRSSGAVDRPVSAPAEMEDAELAAYNEYLAQLAERDRAVADAEARSGGRARTSNIRLQRPTFCRLNYPGSRCGQSTTEVRPGTPQWRTRPCRAPRR